MILKKKKVCVYGIVDWGSCSKKLESHSPPEFLSGTQLALLPRYFFVASRIAEFSRLAPGCQMPGASPFIVTKELPSPYISEHLLGVPLTRSRTYRIEERGSSNPKPSRAGAGGRVAWKGERECLCFSLAVPLATLRSKVWPCHLGTSVLNQW